MTTPNSSKNKANPLAMNLRRFREEEGLSLDDVAEKAQISKTYLWELERDKEGLKKPSANVLMRIAGALSRTLAELLALPMIKAPDGRPIEAPKSLEEFRKRLEGQGQALTESDLHELASMRFRGAQPKTADEWHQLYLFMSSKAGTKQK